MPTYPNLAAATESWELEALAEASGLTPAALAAVLDGAVAPTLSVRYRLARVLGEDPVELFRCEDHVEALLADAPSRYVTDPAALRAVEAVS